MKLIYRGATYDYDPSQARAGTTGYPEQPTQTSQEPYTLVYRGATYIIDPKQPSLEAPLPTSYELSYRGTTYQVNRDTAGRTTMVTLPTRKNSARSVAVPAAFPRQHVAKVHQANILSTLKHRLQVAQERGDQKLVSLLEAELKQTTV
jgi:Domain of unknown function (DUF4278)